MNIDENQRLTIDEGDGFNFRFVPSPNREAGDLTPKLLLLHASESQDVQAAINNFTSARGARSAHLILGRDGKELVQMLNFNMRAQQAQSDLNSKALGIELDYPGPLSEEEADQDSFNHTSKFQPGEILYAAALNEQNEIPTLLRAWPSYPREQMEALVRIARLLVEHYGLEIMGHEEIETFKLDPGPAFPMLTFKDSVKGKSEGSTVFDETRQEVELRSGPGMVYPPRPGGKLQAGTPVVMRSDHDGWALVEVRAAVRGNAWLVGWTKRETINARRNTIVVKEHQLFTADGRQYPLIRPHPNNYDANRKLTKPKYLIMHATGGINVESTIHAFKDEHHGASTHLLIGRDGGVVQFVDFDTVAYHCGYSYWEGDTDLNRFSIGIELDNAQFLKPSDGVWKWKTTVIPDEEVVETIYWKNQGKLGWQRFTDAQLEVAVEIARALQKAYGFKLILGHDLINLPERVDPGPLFPMEDFRQKVFGRSRAAGRRELAGRREPAGNGGLRIKVYEAKPGTLIYKNRDQEPPDLDHPKLSGTLPAGAKVNSQDIKEDWALVKVVAAPGNFNGTRGWIRSNVFNTAQANPKTTQDSEYYKVNPGTAGQPPPSELRQSPLPGGTRLRIDKFEADWALVAALEPVKGNKFLEGWVKQAEITEKGVETLIYPPPSQVEG